MFRRALLAAALTAAGSAAAQISLDDANALQSIQIIRIQADDPGLRQQLGVMVGHFAFDHETGIATLEADAFTRARLRALDLDWTVDEPQTAAARAFAADGIGGLRAIPGYACYRTVEETLDTMDELVADYPALASIIDIGDSWRRTQNPANGYPLRVLRLTNDAVDIGRKPVLFAMSSVHAREYTPAELMTRFAEQLLAGYGVDADSTWLLDNHEFHLLLQANPDGRKRAEQAVLWRKNENTLDAPCGMPISGNFHPGIDLNRNYPWSWNTNGGSSGSLCSATYRGPGSGSEPETSAVVDYLRAIFPDTRDASPNQPSIAADPATQGLFLDMHSHSGLVLWPWGGSGVTGNNQSYVNLGRRLAWFNGYTPQQSVNLYATDGTTIDQAYGDLGVPALTYELGTAFFQDCGSFENTILPANLASLRYGARVLHAPYVLPAGPDTYGLSIDKASVVQGTPVVITATVDDSRYRSGPGGASTIHTIAGANLFVAQLPWQAGAIENAMDAADGTFNASSESVRYVLDTTTLAPGRHLLFVQGHDSGGETGPPAAVFVDIEENLDWIFIDGFEGPRGEVSR